MSYDVQLPWKRTTASVRGMTGIEEDLFADRKKLSDGKTLNTLLTNCTVSLDTAADPQVKPSANDILDLMQCDRSALMVGIRYETYGPSVKATIKCSNPNCRANIVMELSLDNIVDYPASPDQFSPEGHYTLALSDGTKVTFHLITGREELQILRADREHMMTMALSLPLVRVALPNGEVLEENAAKTWIRSAPSRLRDELRQKNDNMQIGPDTRFMAECEECGAETIDSLETLPGFFFPSMSTRKVIRF